jgi:PPOX class probable F420-dependent enzyme
MEKTMTAFSHHTHPHAFSNIEREQYIRLTTLRKNGQSVDTPVWFAVHEGTIYVETGAQSGKVKRIRHAPRVFLAPCTASGKVKAAAVEGKARIVTDTQEIYVAKAALQRKYGFKRVVFGSITILLESLRGRPSGSSIYLAIEPVYIA